MLYWIVDFFRASAGPLYVFAFVVAVFLLISGRDDLIVNLYYWFYYLFFPRKLNRFHGEPPEKLNDVEEKPIAIFVPAWQEHDVIDKMLINACKTIQYTKYDLFVGVYPNDAATLKKVEDRLVNKGHALSNVKLGVVVRSANPVNLGYGYEVGPAGSGDRNSGKEFRRMGSPDTGCS